MTSPRPATGLPVPEPERYVTRLELAGQLGVHPSTIDRWRDAGMPSVLLGPKRGTRRFVASECIEWLRKAAIARMAA